MVIIHLKDFSALCMQTNTYIWLPIELGFLLRLGQ